MARYTYMILSHAKPGQAAAFRTWYQDQHLPDVSRHPDVVGARLYDVALQKVYDLDVPQWVLMTLYELETENPEATVEAIKAMAGTAAMPMTDALEKSGMIQAIGRPIAAIDPATPDRVDAHTQNETA